MFKNINENVVHDLHECKNIVDNLYDLTCKKCNKKLNAVELFMSGHACSKYSVNEEADLIIKCKRCDEIIWDNNDFTEIGKKHKCDK